MNKTVVLLSGGLDSTLCLFWACRFRADGFREAGMEDPAKC